MNLSEVSGSLSLFGLNNNQNGMGQKTIDDGKSFEHMLKDAIGEVNKEQIDGYKAMESIASGKVTNLQEAVQQIEEAELSLKLALETKNKAINAFKEISKMQI